MKWFCPAKLLLNNPVWALLKTALIVKRHRHGELRSGRPGEVSSALLFLLFTQIHPSLLWALFIVFVQAYADHLSAWAHENRRHLCAHTGLSLQQQQKKAFSSFIILPHASSSNYSETHIKK